MSAFKRFISVGLDDADRRVAMALAPPRLDATDRYLHDSRVVSLIDRVTRQVAGWWAGSRVKQRSSHLAETLAGRHQAERYQSVAVIMLTAVSVHVALTLAHGARAGWFWLLIPSMAAVFAVLLAAASRVVR